MHAHSAYKEMNETRSVQFPTHPGNDPGPGGVKTFPKGVLKRGGATLRARKALVYKDAAKGDSIKITPSNNPTVPVPIRRSRVHKHGTRRLRVVSSSRVAREAREAKIHTDSKDMDREELLEVLSSRLNVNPRTKMPIDMLRNMYLTATESGLL